MKKWVRLRESRKTENRIAKAVNSLNLDDSSTKKLNAFIAKGNLSLKNNRKRANNIVKEINAGSFNLEKYLKRDKSYQSNKEEIGKRKLTSKEQVKLLNRTVFYFDNEDLIEDFNENRDNKEIKEELETRYKKYQDDYWGIGFDKIYEAMKKKK